MKILPVAIAIALSVSTGLRSAVAAPPAPGASISFKKTQLDTKFRGEGVAIGDYNHDGKPDIASGSVWYSAPDWQMHLIEAEAKEYDPLKYSNCFNAFSDDLNHDGWADVIEVSYPFKETFWYENPQTAAGPWKRHVCVPVTNNESPNYLDVDGDGKRELIFAFEPGRKIGFAKPAVDPSAPWNIFAVSTENAPNTDKYSHGLGVGDIDKDGHNDILVPQGWWKSPADPTQVPWTFHPADLGDKVTTSDRAAQMQVYDFDGDGDNDVLSSAAHLLGIWWHEQTPEGFKIHEISKAFSQTHSLELADINGDGLPDFVTGKRFWAHGPKGDINPGDPAVLYWFELERKDGKVNWIPHQIDHDSGVGTQIEVTDINGDGLLDVAVANKKGVFCFLQTRTPVSQ
jgi:hypothetical protein